MASKRKKRRSECGNKKRLTQTEAQEFAAFLRRKSRRSGWSGYIDAYRCKHCGHWHAGHRPKKVQFAVTSRQREAKKGQGL